MAYPAGSGYAATKNVSLTKERHLEFFLKVVFTNALVNAFRGWIASGYPASRNNWLGSRCPLATCAPPPVIQCKNNNSCEVFNFQGVWDDRVVCMAQNAAWPTSEAELLAAVANAVKNKKKIRVVSKLSHSEPKLVCVGSGGLMISTRNYASILEINKTAMTIRVQAGALMGDVLEAAAKEGLALNAMTYWNGVSAAGVISTGAHDSGFVGKGSGVYEYLNAARFSLDVVGAISEVTFALEPMYKRSLSTVVRDDGDLEKQAESFLRTHEFADINWIPSHGFVVYIPIDRVPVSVPGEGLNSIIGSAATVDEIQTKAIHCEYTVLLRTT